VAPRDPLEPLSGRVLDAVPVPRGHPRPDRTDGRGPARETEAAPGLLEVAGLVGLVESG